MKHLNAILFFVLLLVFRLPAQSVTYLEYFIDSNPERGQGTQVVFPAGADRTVSFNVPLTNVPFGIHNLYVRAKDQGGHWSFVSSRPFIKAAVDLNKFPEITVLQYFFDNDPGIELADRHTFTPDTAKTLAFNIPLNDIDYGFHNLYMRAKDEYGHWSFVSSRPFLKESVDLYATPNIAALEYFIDTDPGYGAGHTIFGNFADSLAATFTVDLSELADGTHTLFVRGKDEYGRWSLVDSRPFIKEALDLYQPPKINSLRYCFTSGAWRSSEYVYQGFTSGVDRTLNFMADLSGLEVDQTYTLHIYGLDEQGHPAFRQQHNFTVDAPTTVALSIYPTTMDFGSLLPGSRADTVFTFSNTGSADLNIQDITLSTSDTSDFQLVSAGEAVTLAPGASKTDTLRFAPQTTGNKNARLIITSNAPTSPDTVEIAGKGVSPQLAVSTDTLNFNNTLAGSFTIDSVLIKNSGSATLNVDTVQLAGADSAKFLVTTPEFELAAGDSQFLKIKFLPDSAAAFTALLKIYSDGGNDSVTLHGSGIAPQMKITPLTINYENILVHETAGDSILIQNSGSAALALDTIRVSGADAANFVADTTLFSLASGDSQFLPIHFTPDRTAEFSAQLLISGNAGNQSISLTGNCVNYEMTVASDTLKFGQAALNTTLTDSVVISNTGTLALLFDSIRVINANRQLFLVDTTAFTLAAGDSQILPVSFTPDISGNFTAQLKISSEAGQELVHLQGFCVVAELTVTPPALDFGNVRAGNSALDSIKIKNTGLAKLELEEIKLSGTDSAQFETDTTIFSLAPGDSQFQTIRFIPNSTGEFSAVLDISSTGGNRQINLSGTGVETKMTVSRDSIRFGEVQLQATVRDSLSIINSGTLELDIYSIKLQGTAARHFAVDTTKFKLAPGDSQVLQISFTPDSSGSLTAALEITSNGGNESIALAGVGIAPKMTVLPPAIDFGSIQVKTTAFDSVRITNAGSAELQIDSIRITGVNPVNFSTDTTRFTLAPGDSHSLEISFAPDLTKKFTAALSLVSNGGNETIALAGTGVETKMTVSTDSIRFGEVQLQATVRDSLSITNSGTLELDISSIKLQGSAARHFAVDTTKFKLAPGDSQILQISFTPDSSGSLTAALEITSNGGNESIVLAGVGVAPKMTVLPPAIDFENVSVDTTAFDSIIIKNSGTAELQIDSIRITGVNPDNFSTDTTRFTLVPGDSHSLQISFTPDTTKNFSAALQLASNGGNETIALTGTGVETEMTVSIDSIRFGEVQLQATVQDSLSIINSGTLELDIYSIKLQGSADRHFAVDTTKFKLAPGDSQVLQISFTPDTSGSLTAALEITSNGGNKSIVLTGVGIAPKMTVLPLEINFGSIQVKRTVFDSVRIRNSGSAELKADSIRIIGANFDNFSADTTLFSLAPGDSHSLKISFTPDTTKNFSAALQLASNGGNKIIALTGTGVETEMTVSTDSIRFGEVKLQATVRDSLSITNSGTLELDIYSIKLQGSAARHFAVDTTKFKLAPGDSQVLQISFTPDTSGSLTAALEITSNGGNKSIVLSGVGNAPKMTVLPPAIDFENVSVDTTAFDSIIIKNSGTAKLKADSIRVIGANFDNFSADTTLFALAPGDSHSLKISFTPDTTKDFSAALHLASNGGNETVALAGTGIKMEIAASRDSINFGAVELQRTARDSLTISNPGSLELNVYSIVLEGLAAGNFTVDTTRFKLAPGDSQLLPISFTPDTSGRRLAVLKFVSNAGNKIVRLIGTGVETEMKVSADSTDFGPVLVGAARLDSVRILNSGTIELQIDSLRIRGIDRDNFAVDTTTFALAPGDSQFLVINFTPDSVNTFRAWLQIYHSGGSQRTIFTGSGIAPQLSTVPPTLDFGEVLLGETGIDSVLLRNLGQAQLKVDTLRISGAHPANFISNAPLPALAPGDSLFQKISFTPHRAGSFTAILEIKSDGGESNIALTGTGIKIELTLAADTLDFHQVQMNSTALDSLLLINTGNIVLKIDSLRLQGKNTKNFLADSRAFFLAAGDSHFLKIEFIPDARGSFSAALKIFGTAGEQQIFLTGSGIAPLLAFSHTNFNFGTLPLEFDSTQTLKIMNRGNTVLALDSLQISGGNQSDFTIPNYGAGCEIKAAGLLNVPVRFSPQAEGTRNALLVGWSNCVSSPDTVFLAGEGFHLALEVEHDSTATLGESLDFTVAQPQHFQPTITRLYYRCTGQQKWKFIELQSTGEGYNVIIPPDSITNRGVEYFISLADSTHEITYPALNARENPALIRVAIEQYFSPVSLPKITYKMVSVPIDLDQPDIASVLADDFGEYDIQHWRLVRWQEGAVQDYVENAELAEQFVPGTAFWLITREGKIFDVENGRSVDASEPFRVRLAPGWNQVGNPFAFPVAWHDIEAPETVGAPVWFDGIEYSDYNVPVLQPWEGYFIQNRSERVVEIAIPAKEAVRDLGKAANRLVVDSENEYILQIAARIPRSRLIDTQNYIGWRQQATNSRDRLDFSEAPPIGEFLQLSIIEDEEKFAGNFKSLTKEGQRWEMQLTATLPRSKIQIDLIETGNLPETFGLYVLDQDYRCIIPVRQNSFEIYLDKQFPVRHLKMILGTEEYAQLHSSGIPLVPIEYALKQNFPNPFNPATTIQYQLSRRGAVLLEIYNMLGQRTRLLVDKIQNTGNHAITWNGRDDTGKAVASGVYLCKIKAGKFSATRKLILVR